MITPRQIGKRTAGYTCKLSVVFFLITLMTEFFYVDVIGGHLRPYHFAAPVVILLLFRYISNITESRLFLVLFALLFINLFAAFLADKPDKALISYFLLMANASIAIASAFIMISRRVSYQKVVSIFIFVTVISVGWSVVQLVVLRLMGENWGLSESQSIQLATGFAPGFRTEANTFAKYLNVSFLLVFPTVYRFYSTKARFFILIVFSTGFLLTFTRSVLYTIPITILVSYMWYISTGSGNVVLKRMFTTLLLFSVLFIIFSSVVVTFNDYAAYKITTFFDTKEIISGGSSGTRLLWQQALIDSFYQSRKTVFIGNGWGQVFMLFGDNEIQVGGSEVVLFLSYGGLISGLLYVFMQVLAVLSPAKLGRISASPTERAYYQGVAFACLGMMITGLINGSVNAPEYWIMYGLAIHANYIMIRREFYKSNIEIVRADPIFYRALR